VRDLERLLKCTVTTNLYGISNQDRRGKLTLSREEAMGQRCMEETAQGFNEYRAVRFGLMIGSHQEPEQVSVVLTVHNDWDTLDFVKDNLNAIASNLLQIKRQEAELRKQMDESEQLFSSNLHPLFALMSATAPEHVMDKLSISLKKALLLMAMERYSCDSERICRILGITRAKLEKELQRCGISREAKKEA
jgi:DNA-binding protein Fis